MKEEYIFIFALLLSIAVIFTSNAQDITYKCVNFECVQGDDGPYTTSNCDNMCSPAPPSVPNLQEGVAPPPSPNLTTTAPPSPGTPSITSTGTSSGTSSGSSTGGSSSSGNTGGSTSGVIPLTNTQSSPATTSPATQPQNQQIQQTQETQQPPAQSSTQPTATLKKETAALTSNMYFYIGSGIIALFIIIGIILLLKHKMKMSVQHSSQTIQQNNPEIMRIKNYISTYMGKGYSKEQIVASLQNSGVSKQIIDEALSYF